MTSCRRKSERKAHLLAVGSCGLSLPKKRIELFDFIKAGMPRKKTSKKQGNSFKDMPTLKLKKSSSVSTFGASKRMKNKEYISKALWECLVADDPEGFKEILKTHLDLVNKDAFVKRTGISRRTLYRMLSDEGNPTLDNISKIVNKLCA